MSVRSNFRRLNLLVEYSWDVPRVACAFCSRSTCVECDVATVQPHCPDCDSVSKSAQMPRIIYLTSDTHRRLVPSGNVDKKVGP